MLIEILVLITLWLRVGLPLFSLFFHCAFVPEGQICI